MELFFDHIPAVTAADNEIVHAVSRVELQNVPKNRATPDFNHWLGFDMGFFGDARPQTAGQNYRFHLQMAFFDFSES
jgi:hypothetical protein